MNSLCIKRIKVLNCNTLILHVLYMTKHLNLVIADWFVSVSSGYTSSFCTSSLHAHQDLEWFTCENYIFHVFTRLNYIYKYIYILYFIGYIYITFVKTHPTYFEINTCHKTRSEILSTNSVYLWTIKAYSLISTFEKTWT